MYGHAQKRPKANTVTSTNRAVVSSHWWGKPRRIFSILSFTWWCVCLSIRLFLFGRKCPSIVVGQLDANTGIFLIHIHKSMHFKDGHGKCALATKPRFRGTARGCAKCRILNRIVNRKITEFKIRDTTDTRTIRRSGETGCRKLSGDVRGCPETFFF